MIEQRSAWNKFLRGPGIGSFIDEGASWLNHPYEVREFAPTNIVHKMLLRPQAQDTTTDDLSVHMMDERYLITIDVVIDFLQVCGKYPEQKLPIPSKAINDLMAAWDKYDHDGFERLRRHFNATHVSWDPNWDPIASFSSQDPTAMKAVGILWTEACKMEGVHPAFTAIVPNMFALDSIKREPEGINFFRSDDDFNVRIQLIKNLAKEDARQDYENDGGLPYRELKTRSNALRDGLHIAVVHGASPKQLVVSGLVNQEDLNDVSRAREARNKVKELISRISPEDMYFISTDRRNAFEIAQKLMRQFGGV